MSLKNIIIPIFLLAVLPLFAETPESQTAAPIEAAGDSIAPLKNDSLPQSNDWWTLLKKGKLDLKDKNVHYPRFMRFCVDVYNWADTTFNSYNPDYVVGTGKRWKVYLKDDNWFDSYAMNFGDGMKMFMASDLTVNLGAYLQYMAVSVGYSFDMTNIITNKPINYKRFDFGFTCARFTADAYYTENSGGSYIRKFGKYNKGNIFTTKEYFPGVYMKSYGVDVYYFVNNRKYSQGAAYNFAKIQLRPSGSIIAGFTYSREEIGLDFTQLPEDLLPYLTAPVIKGKFNYDLFCLMAGYGYSLPFGHKKRFLYNVTAIPTFGLIHNFPDSFEGSSYMFSSNVKGRMALVYNYKDIFVGLQGKIDAHWYKSKVYSFVSSLITVSLSAGVRF